MSPACERLTCYPVQAFIDDTQLLDLIVHPEDQALIITQGKRHSIPWFMISIFA